MSMLEHALEYAAEGWAVFPCADAGHPTVKGKAPLTQNGFHDATTDPNRIRFWWGRMRPDALIGAPVPAGAVVLDIDPRNGGSLAALPDLPETLTCVSGRGDGGVHLYFYRPVGARLTARGLDGIDLKDAGKGYCIVPPSLHPGTGMPYCWEGSEVAEMPPSLLAVLRVPEVPAGVGPLTVGDGSGLVRFVAGLPEGERNSGLFWAACEAVRSGALGSVRGDLIGAAIAVGLDEAEAVRTVDSAERTEGVAS